MDVVEVRDVGKVGREKGLCLGKVGIGVTKSAEAGGYVWENDCKQKGTLAPAMPWPARASLRRGGRLEV